MLIVDEYSVFGIFSVDSWCAYTSHSNTNYWWQNYHTSGKSWTFCKNFQDLEGWKSKCKVLEFAKQWCGWGLQWCIYQNICIHTPPFHIYAQACSIVVHGSHWYNTFNSIIIHIGCTAVKSSRPLPWSWNNASGFLEKSSNSNLL